MRVGGSNKINVLLNYRLAFSLLIIYSFLVVITLKKSLSLRLTS